MQPNWFAAIKYITLLYKIRIKPVHHIPVLGLLPARMREISSPRLKAWLNMSRVWKVDTKGNQDKNAIGMKISIPIPASYRRPIERMDFHNPIRFITGFQADAIWKTEKRENLKP